MQPFTLYEHNVVLEHLRLYPTQDVRHWSVVPDEWLLDSGWIHSTNRLRVQRRLANQQRVRYEYGLDGLALEPDGTFHGLQAKMYEPRQQLTANDLGTFLSAVYNRLLVKNPASKGHLYHTCGLQVDLRDDLLHAGRIICHRFAPTGPVVPVPAVDVDESTFVLRPYQRDAITALREFYEDPDETVGVLTMPCGTGKTLTVSQWLRGIMCDIVIYVAPLIALVDQNAERIGKFLPTYEHVRVHSGPGGTTDVDFVDHALSNAERVFVATTFDSFREIICQIDFADQNVVVVIDEAHDFNGLDEIDGFPKVALVTATPPSAFEDVASEIFTYKLGDAIAAKHVCDYNIWVPDVESTIPDELERISHNALAPKALFIVNNMLLKGSRRCIAYLSTHDEVRAFRELLQIVAHDYHGLPIWTDEIIATTTNRDDVFRAFESDESPELLRILCSIRICDQGIDLPKCDSVFVTNVSEQSSEIRMVQRMCRANRLDPARSSKESHVFLWHVDEFGKIIHVLDQLRDVDPEYLKKIHVAPASYDAMESREARTTRREVERGSLDAYAAVHAISPEERAIRWAREVAEFFTRTGRFPSKESKDPDEKRTGQWLSNMRKAKRGTGGMILRPAVEAILDAIPEPWCPEEDAAAIRRAREVAAFFARTGRFPPQQSKDPDEKRMGKWLSHMRQAKRGKGGGNILHPAAEAILDAIPEPWCPDVGDPVAAAVANARAVAKFFTENDGRFPSETSKDPDVKRLGKWLLDMRQAKRGKTKSVLRPAAEAILDAIPEPWCPDVGDPVAAAVANARAVAAFFARTGRFPSVAAKDPDEKRMGQWLSGMRCAKRGIKTSNVLRPAAEAILEAIPEPWCPDVSQKRARLG